MNSSNLRKVKKLCCYPYILHHSPLLSFNLTSLILRRTHPIPCISMQTNWLVMTHHDGQKQCWPLMLKKQGAANILVLHAPVMGSEGVPEASPANQPVGPCLRLVSWTRHEIDQNSVWTCLGDKRISFSLDFCFHQRGILSGKINYFLEGKNVAPDNRTVFLFLWKM